MSEVSGFLLIAIVLLALAVLIATMALWRDGPGGEADKGARTPPPSRPLILALALVIPLASGLLYLQLGSPSLLAAPPTVVADVQQAGTAMPSVDADAVAGAAGELIRQLQLRLENDPDDAHAWVLLARSLLFEERYADAADAFSQAVALGSDDVTVLTQYADVLAHTRGGSLAGEPERALHEALRIDPDYGHALWLAGNAAYQQGQYQKTLQYWGRLMPQLEPGTEPAMVLENNMRQVRERLEAVD